MAGHSKWANIKHKKAKNDGLRQKSWSKLLKEITVAAKLGGGEVDSNPRLRAAIVKSRSQSLPQKNIESAVKKGVGGNDGKDLFELVYEGYGVAGTAFIIEAMTDNKARTAADVRLVFSKHKGSMGEAGAVSWGFEKDGQIVIAKKSFDFDDLLELSLELGADDVYEENEFYIISATAVSFDQILSKLEIEKIEIVHAELGMSSKTKVKVSGIDREKLECMIEAFEELDDVQNIYHNMILSEKVLTI